MTMTQDNNGSEYQTNSPASQEVPTQSFEVEVVAYNAEPRPFIDLSSSTQHPAPEKILSADETATKQARNALAAQNMRARKKAHIEMREREIVELKRTIPKLQRDYAEKLAEKEQLTNQRDFLQGIIRTITNTPTFLFFSHPFTANANEQPPENRPPL